MFQLNHDRRVSTTLDSVFFRAYFTIWRGSVVLPQGVLGLRVCVHFFIWVKVDLGVASYCTLCLLSIYCQYATRHGERHDGATQGCIGGPRSRNGLVLHAYSLPILSTLRYLDGLHMCISEAIHGGLIASMRNDNMHAISGCPLFSDCHPSFVVYYVTAGPSV